MKKQIINTPQAPAPIGPYNQAVKAGNTFYISGQIPLIPETMELVNGDIKAATQQVMQNLDAILKTAGMSFKNVVKSSIFLETMDDFAAVNEVYGSYFDEATAPARETVAVKTLPKSVGVEISMIAIE